MSKRLTDFETKNIINEYLVNKLSTIKIASIFNKSPQCINNLLTRNKISIRTKSEAQQERQKYSKIPNDFSLFPLTPLSTYFIGQVYGDGSIHKNGHSVSVTSSDLDNLNNINKLFNNICTISKERSKAKRITICKKSLVDELKNSFKLVNDKSDKLVFPYTIPNDMMPYFISGLLSSDGMIKIRKRGSGKLLIIQFTSCSKIFLEDLSNYFSSILKIQNRKLYLKNKNKIGFGKKNCYDLTYYSKDAETICNWIFTTACNQEVRCERKYKNFLKYYEDL